MTNRNPLPLNWWRLLWTTPLQKDIYAFRDAQYFTTGNWNRFLEGLTTAIKFMQLIFISDIYVCTTTVQNVHIYVINVLCTLCRYFWDLYIFRGEVQPPKTFGDYCYTLPITHAYLMVLSDKLWHPNDVFKQYPEEDKILFIHAVGVNTLFRKRGIAKNLVNFSFEVRKYS